MCVKNANVARNNLIKTTRNQRKLGGLNFKLLSPDYCTPYVYLIHVISIEIRHYSQITFGKVHIKLPN